MSQKQPISIEAALKRLEEIISLMEQDIDNLETAVNLYEEGSQLVAYCAEKLKEVENKIEILTHAQNGEQGE
ncbi:MAG: exodeoxyribonuclease VII small subunit [Candidatus Cloacimonetes bacterium]|nr:exodeoxyribonuclease VII small subunit [Candidatus Cloacimonadota bacterium]